MSHIIFLNNDKINSEAPCINALDRGFTLGHGLFETILVKKGAIPFLEYHWNRLSTSCNSIFIKIPFDKQTMETMIKDIIIENKLENVEAYVRLTLTDGIYARGILSDGNQLPTFTLTASKLPEKTNDTLSATIVKTQRNENSMSSRIKSISFLDNILAKKEAVNNGFDEAFLLNSKFHLAEGSISNVFLVKNNTLYTPRIEDGALPGVTRHVIINHLPFDHFKVVEMSIDKSFIFEADEIFITNALMGIKPIHKLDHKIYSNFETSCKISKILKEKFDYR